MFGIVTRDGKSTTQEQPAREDILLLHMDGESMFESLACCQRSPHITLHYCQQYQDLYNTALFTSMFCQQLLSFNVGALLRYLACSCHQLSFSGIATNQQYKVFVFRLPSVYACASSFMCTRYKQNEDTHIKILHHSPTGGQKLHRVPLITQVFQFLLSFPNMNICFKAFTALPLIKLLVRFVLNSLLSRVFIYCPNICQI